MSELSVTPETPSPDPELPVSKKKVSKKKTAKPAKPRKPVRGTSKKSAKAKSARPVKAKAGIKAGVRVEPSSRSLLGQRPTRNGKPIKSSWMSRTHMRMQSDRKSAILCQRDSRSPIWKRDLISVGPGQNAKVTCRRCERVLTSLGK